MSRIVKVSNGDYRLQVQTGGNIILDTQSTNGKILVIGQLDVQGALTYIESTVTEIADPVIYLNQGQTGNGISAANGYSSGIEVRRGNYSDAQFIFNEQLTHYDSTVPGNVSGTWSVRTADGKLNGLQLRTLTTDGTGNLTFDLQNSSVTLRIANSATYYQNVSDNNDIPNLQYVKAYVASTYNGSGQGTALTSSIQYPITGTLAAANSSVQTGASNVIFQIGGGTISTIDTNGITTGYVRVGGGTGAQLNTINNTSSNNLILTATNNNVEVNAVLNLDNQASTPTYVSGASKIYSSATNGPGKSGIYFTNSNNQTPDELISRNRAVLLSIIF